MLKNDLNPDVNLIELKKEMISHLSPDLKQYVVDSEMLQLEYPVLEYPTKVVSMSFDKTNEISGKLTGIKGQYLMLDNQFVLNVRKHTGYVVSLNY
jgi:hypothetical protein